MTTLKQLINKNIVSVDGITVGEAMKMITSNRRGSIIIIDEGGYLLGVVSDGDIRRAMVRGATKLTPIVKCVNKNPVTCNEFDDEESIRTLFEKKVQITLIPIISKENKLIDVMIRN